MEKKFKLFEEFRSNHINEDVADVERDSKSNTLQPKEFDRAYKNLSTFRDVLLDPFLADNTDVKSILSKFEPLYKEVALQWPKIEKWYELQREYLQNKAEEPAKSEEIEPEGTAEDIAETPVAASTETEAKPE